ncbi:MAG: hypothetical protein H0W88_10700 [Parachlamydiaceae bacterium]|nr:hypothetical protein [Parachlamydiaceae bacterium]
MTSLSETAGAAGAPRLDFVEATWEGTKPAPIERDLNLNLLELITAFMPLDVKEVAERVPEWKPRVLNKEKYKFITFINLIIENLDPVVYKDAIAKLQDLSKETTLLKDVSLAELLVQTDRLSIDLEKILQNLPVEVSQSFVEKVEEDIQLNKVIFQAQIDRAVLSLHRIPKDEITPENKLTQYQFLVDTCFRNGNLKKALEIGFFIYAHEREAFPNFDRGHALKLIMVCITSVKNKRDLEKLLIMIDQVPSRGSWSTALPLERYYLNSDVKYSICDTLVFFAYNSGYPKLAKKFLMKMNDKESHIRPENTYGHTLRRLVDQMQAEKNHTLKKLKVLKHFSELLLSHITEAETYI